MKSEKGNKSHRLVAGVVVRVQQTPQTIVVAVTRIWRHPLYRKAVRRTKHYLVHDEKQEVAVGDKVLISETKPISKNKHFILVSKTL